MIAYIEGTLVHKSPTCLILDVGGIGYRVNIPLSSYERIGSEGTKVRALTVLYVREDVLQLYGFATEEERELFEILLTVSGIGPRVAQAILSGMSVSDFKQRVAAGDIRGLTAIPGVGKKMASRLVVELKDRFGGAVFAPKEGVTVGAGPPASPAEEAALALISLGFDPGTAHRLVGQVVKGGGDGMAVEQIIKAALRQT
jgi:Holliday junction DNA helicase RuvA